MREHNWRLPACFCDAILVAGANVLMADSTDADRVVTFQTELTTEDVRAMSGYVKKHYLEPNLASLQGGAYKELEVADQAIELEWSFSPPSVPGRIAQPLKGKTIHLTLGLRSASIKFTGLDSSDPSGVAACSRVADDLEVLCTVSLSKARTTSLYFIFSTEEQGAAKDHPAGPPTGGEALRRLTNGNMTNLYIVIMAASFGLFFVLGNLAIFIVLAIQLATLFFSDRIALLVGRVRPNASMPRVTIVSVQASEEMKGLVASFAKGVVAGVSEKLAEKLPYDALRSPGANELVQQVLSDSGIKTSTDSIRIVTRDVYSVVKGVADQFRLPVPRITIVNTVADNAAATGISPGRSSITITAGSLEDLTDDELSSVVGHELGHIKGRDSLILFCVTFFLYFGGLYLWFPLLLFLGLFYYVVVFGTIFSVGKVLETRADTESANTLGRPSVLASALRRIGFRQLYSERYSRGAKVVDWLAFDPHPPIYFRVQRLSELAARGRKTGNTLLVSVRDVISGFFSALT